MKTKLLSIFVIAALFCLEAAGQHKAFTTQYDWKPLADEITQGAGDQREQLEKIYKWICGNIAYDTSGTVYKADDCLDTRKGVCQAYCEIFFRLAEALDIQSVIITGETKDFDNSLSADEHTWMLADSGLGWILIDPTWGAGSVSDGVFTRSESDMSWFDVNPYIMVSSHLPFDESYQRIPTPISREQFLKMDRIDPVFGLLSINAAEAFEQAIENRLEVPVMYGTVNENMLLKSIPLKDTLKVGEKWRFVAGKSDRYRYEIRMDDKPIHEGCWTYEEDRSVAEFMVACENNVFIYILDRNAREGEVAAAFEYKVSGDMAGWKAVQEQDPYLSPEMKGIKNINIPFMRLLGIDGRKLIEELEANSTDTVPIMYGGLEKVEIINIPLHSPLKIGQEYTFEFKCSNWRHYAVINGDIWHEGWDRTARKDGIYRMTVKITEPGSVMLAYSNGTSYNFFLEYTATY